MSTTPELIEPDALAALDPATYQLFHVAKREDYERGHIEGARCVEPRALICGIPPASGRLPEQSQIEAMLCSIDYDPTLRAIVYDDEGGGWAGRLAWTLDIIGHAEWAYLNGGLHAWAGAGQAIQAGSAPPSHTKAVAIQLDLGPVAEIPDVLAAIENDNARILDVRSAEEYAGLRPAAARSGHIPGAVHFDWLDMMDRARHLRLLEDLEARWSAVGIEAQHAVITHCQTHHRSGLSYMAARLMGFANIRAYHGSWSEWGNREDTPIE